MGHSIQDCQDFLELVCEMMDGGIIEFCKRKEGQAVNVMQRETLKLVTIFYRVEGQQAPAKVPFYPTPRVVIKVPTPFRYISDKVVSWNYANQIVSQESQAVRVSPKKKQDPSVNDIVRTGRMTCSGRCYASDFSGEKE